MVGDNSNPTTTTIIMSSDNLQVDIVGHSTVQQGVKRPYTVYHIRVRIGGGSTSSTIISYDLNKRYSDFDGFNSRLIRETGHEPPNRLPPKTVATYYKSLLSSLGGGPGPNANDVVVPVNTKRTRRRSSFNKHTQDDELLVDERQNGLQRYLDGIVNARDGQWRQSKEWVRFLEIPQQPNNSSTTQPPPLSSYAITDPVQWLESFREAKTLVQEAKTQAPASPHGAKAKLAQVSVKLSMLEAGLSPQNQQALAHAGLSSLGRGELQRRTDLIEGLKLSQQQVANSISTTSCRPTAPQPHSTARVLGRPIPESPSTVDRSNQQLLQLQVDQMQDQDAQIQQLHQIISRQKQLGLDIGSELELQNEMLDLLQEEAHVTGAKVNLATKRIDKIH